MPPNALPSLPAGYSTRWIDERLEIAHAWRRQWGATMSVLGAVLVAFAALPFGMLKLVGVMGLLYGGFLLPWLGAAYLFNRTRFAFDVRGLRVKHGPVALKPSRRFHRSEIKALHVEDHGVKQPSWYLGVELVSGRRVYIIEGAERFEDAKRLERVIAKQLELREPAAPDHDEGLRVPEMGAAGVPVVEAAQGGRR